MGYLYLLAVAIMFSFGGTCNRMITPYFGPSFIAFFRFFFGVLFLLLLKLILKKPFQKDFRQVVKMLFWWILMGAAAKWVAYIFENTGLTMGPSYGNIVLQPAQAIFVTLASVVLFHEKISKAQIFCIFLCIAGVLCISWNGKDMSSFFHDNVLANLFFVLAGVFAGAHVIAQKMVADKMDIIDSNLSIFMISSVLAVFPLVKPVTSGALTGVHPDIFCLLGIVGFGFITGIGFYLNAKAIPLVPLYMVPIVQSAMVIFAIIWGILFFHESVSVYIIVGTIVFMVGLIWLQILTAMQKKNQA